MHQAFRLFTGIAKSSPYGLSPPCLLLRLQAFAFRTMHLLATVWESGRYPISTLTLHPLGQGIGT
jgi:hypothetical protein